MILCLFFFCVCGIVTSSPVAEVKPSTFSEFAKIFSSFFKMTIDQVEEDRGLVGDIAMGILVGKIQEMLGITTTPKPRPIIGILIEAISCFSFFSFSSSSSSSSSPPTTAKSKSQNQKNLKMYNIHVFPRWHRRPSWGRNHDDSRPTHRRGEVKDFTFIPMHCNERLGLFHS